MLANRVYPPLIHHKRYARNGFVPDARFLRALVRNQNHAVAYRHKSFFTAGDLDNPMSSVTGTRVWYRFRCHTGYGATHIAFKLGIPRVDYNEPPNGTDPRVEVSCTIAGGATSTATYHCGLNEGGTTDAPNTVDQVTLRVPVAANTTYEVAISVIDYARILWGTAYEEASNVIDSSVDFFITDGPNVLFPVYDSLRERLLVGMSSMWKRNGSQPLSWSQGISPPSFTGNTFTNIVDGATSVSANSAGYYLGDTGRTLEPWCRISAPTTLNVVLAVHANVSTTVGGTGEVRLQDSTGTRCSITGINAAGTWTASTTTIANVDTMTKVDVQARTSTAANTAMELTAVSLYTYVA